MGRLRSGFAPAGRQQYAAPSVEHGGCPEKQRRLPCAVPILKRLRHQVDPLQPQGATATATTAVFVNSKRLLKLNSHIYGILYRSPQPADQKVTVHVCFSTFVWNR
jgi:hypothetical protein